MPDDGQIHIDTRRTRPVAPDWTAEQKATRNKHKKVQRKARRANRR